MRKLKFSLAILFASALFLIPGLGYAIDEPSIAAWENKSRATGDSQPVRVLKMVRNQARGQDTATLASGDAVSYSTVSDDGITIGVSTVSGDAAFAGILATAIPTADSDSVRFQDDRGRRNWGWSIVHGPANAAVTAGGTNGHSAGDLLITSEDDGKVTTLELRNGATLVSTAEMRKVVGGRGGFFFDAVTAANTREEVFVELE